MLSAESCLYYDAINNSQTCPTLDTYDIFIILIGFTSLNPLNVLALYALFTKIVYFKGMETFKLLGKS